MVCRRSEVFNIYPIGDIHAGSIHCDEKGIKNAITEITKCKNAYIVGMGDYADCILKDDNRFDIGGLSPWLEKDNIVESQREWVTDLFKPVKNKIITLLTGNHEETIHGKYQMDFTRNICKDLGVPYGGYSCFIALNFTRADTSRHEYIIHAWHGAGAAQTEGARLMRLMRLVNEIQAHIYLMGHLHAVTLHMPERLFYRRGKILSTKLVATITGSWLTAYTQPKQNEKLNASYAEMKGYKPNVLGCPIVHICPEKDYISVES